MYRVLFAPLLFAALAFGLGQDASAQVIVYRPARVYRPAVVYAPAYPVAPGPVVALSTAPAFVTQQVVPAVPIYGYPGALYYRPAVVRAKVYVPGQPVRNAIRAVTP